MIQEAICTKCLKLKPIEDFNVRKASANGYSARCKICNREDNAKRYRTKKGLVSQIRATQVSTSKRRGHPIPTYTSKELYEELMGSTLFHELFDAWEQSDFDHNLVPSIDRLDDYKPYSFDNIRLTTWGENNSKANKDRRNGVNNKVSKRVQQTSLDGLTVKEYHSARHASRETGIRHTCINKVCLGLDGRKVAGGYTWKYL